MDRYEEIIRMRCQAAEARSIEAYDAFLEWMKDQKFMAEEDYRAFEGMKYADKARMYAYDVITNPALGDSERLFARAFLREGM